MAILLTTYSGTRIAPVINWQDKNIKDFTSEDTIYINRMTPSGHIITYYCQFVKLERGVVEGKIIAWEPDWGNYSKKTHVKARVNKCYLWGVTTNDNLGFPHCNWFQKTGVAMK